MKRLLHFSALAARHVVCSTASSAARASPPAWPTASSAAPATSTRRCCRRGCGRSAASWPPTQRCRRCSTRASTDIAERTAGTPLQTGGRRLPGRARPPWHRRVRAGDAGVDHGPGADLRGGRPPAPRAGRPRSGRSSPTACRATPTTRSPRPSTLLPRHQRWMTRRFAMVARQGSIARERAKDILVLENLGARRVLHELARRAAERGGPADVDLAFCVTASELADFVARPGRLRRRSSPHAPSASATSTSASPRRGSRGTSPIRPRGCGGQTPGRPRRSSGRRSTGIAVSGGHGVGTGPGHPRPCRPTRPRARRRPRLPDHRPVVDATVPRRRRGRLRHRCRAEPRRRSSRASSASPPCSACRASPRSPTARCCTSTAPTAPSRIG